MGCQITDAVYWLGETRGFWIQTGAFVFSAIGGIAIIFNNSHQARRRATIDLALSESQNKHLIDAKAAVAHFHREKRNFTELACDQAHEDHKIIQVVLNNYEFIAAGIKEGAFDEEIYKRMKRSLLIRDWDAFSGYIAELRRARQHKTLFTEFEWLVEKWKKSEITATLPWYRRVLIRLGM